MSNDLNYQPPPYPMCAFYLVIKNAAEEVWKKTQAPDALVCMEMLSAMAVCAQGLYDVRLPSGQLRPLSLNLLAVAESGERKTGIHNTVAEPLYAFDKASIKRHAADVDAYEVENRIWKSVDAGLRRQITKLSQDGQSIDELRLKIVEHSQRKPIKPRARRIMRQNATERAIVDALQGDGESIAFVSDEGEIIIKGGALRQTGVLNKAWDGAAMLTLDRSDGVSVVACNPRVTVSYMVQSQVLKELLDRRGDNMRVRDTGLAISSVGQRRLRELVSHIVSMTIGAICRSSTKRMEELLTEFARRVDSGVVNRTTLEFAEDAIPRWIELANHTERMLQPWGYMHDIKDFASKALEIAGRVAALLHVFSKQEGKISVESLNRAVEILDWHLHAFKQIFSPPSVPQEQRDAQILENYLHANYWCRGFNFAQKNLVLRSGPVRPAARLDAAINCLMAHQRVWIGVGAKRERYINLNAAHFGSLPVANAY